MWTLNNALPFIQELAPKIRALDYHLCLAGGVLNKGYSTYDLDLWFLPLTNGGSSPQKVVDLLQGELGPLTPLWDYDYVVTGDIPYRVKEMLRGEYCGCRVDLFIL